MRKRTMMLLVAAVAVILTAVPFVASAAPAPDYTFSADVSVCETITAVFSTTEDVGYQVTFLLDDGQEGTLFGDGNDSAQMSWDVLDTSSHDVRMVVLWAAGVFPIIDETIQATAIGCEDAVPDGFIEIDGVRYPATNTAGPVVQYAVPEVTNPTSAHTSRHVWNGVNGAELLPCEFGTFWVDNSVRLVISHCLDDPNPPTTTTEAPEVTTTTEAPEVTTTTEAPEVTTTTEAPEVTTTTEAPEVTTTTEAPSTTTPKETTTTAVTEGETDLVDEASHGFVVGAVTFAIQVVTNPWGAFFTLLLFVITGVAIWTAVKNRHEEQSAA